MSDMPASTSEDHGISVLTDNDLFVYSVGISTGGVAEMRMARLNPMRRIVATTIDQKGVTFAQQQIETAGLAAQIETKLEDVAKALPYPDNHFDYIYARLVLHYLTSQQLDETLKELRRVLKPGGKVFVVVRSVECSDATQPDGQYDPTTHLTTVTHRDPSGGTHQSSRYFHTPDSISSHLRSAGFSVEYVQAYDEQLFTDFQRSVVSDNHDNVIELLANK